MPHKDPIKRLEYFRAYQKKNHDMLSKRAYKTRIKRMYGLTPNEVLRMKEQQSSKCLICENEKRLVIDHCHQTGRVRGLLCVACNAGLGVYEKLSGKVQDYLRRNQCFH